MGFTKVIFVLLALFCFVGDAFAGVTTAIDPSQFSYLIGMLLAIIFAVSFKAHL